MLINKQGADIFILLSNEKGATCSNRSLKLRLLSVCCTVPTPMVKLIPLCHGVLFMDLSGTAHIN